MPASTTEEVALQDLPRASQHVRHEHANGPEAASAPQDAAQQSNEHLRDAQEEWRPSRRYQTVLLAAGFAMIFHVIGINSIYGIFQEFYTSPASNIKGAQGEDALVSLVGTIGTGLTWSGSIFVNPLIARTQRVHFIMLSGVFVMSLGIFLASFSTELWHLYLTQALLYGIGASLYYFPILALTPAYFDRHRGFALGFILSGAGVGGLILSPVMSTLISRLGVGWALRILGIWNLVVGIPVSFVVKKRGNVYNSGRGRTRVDLSVAKRGAFIWQAFGAFLQAGGNVVPTYFLTTYSVSVLAYSPSKASLLLAINNAVNSVARIGMGVLADRVGRQNTLIVSVRGAALRGVGARAVARCAARALRRVRRRVRRARGRVQRAAADDARGGVRRAALRVRERRGVLHPRARRALRRAPRGRHPRQPPPRARPARGGRRRGPAHAPREVHAGGGVRWGLASCGDAVRRVCQVVRRAVQGTVAVEGMTVH